MVMFTGIGNWIEHIFLKDTIQLTTKIYLTLLLASWPSKTNRTDKHLQESQITFTDWLKLDATPRKSSECNILTTNRDFTVGIGPFPYLFLIFVWLCLPLLCLRCAECHIWMNSIIFFHQLCLFKIFNFFPSMSCISIFRIMYNGSSFSKFSILTFKVKWIWHINSGRY